jgi:hypothetical protein
VNGDHGRGHHSDQRRGGDRGHEPEGDREAAEELGAAGDPGVVLAGAEPDLVEHPRGPADSAAPEGSEELLGSVGGEDEADDEAQAQ